MRQATDRRRGRLPEGKQERVDAEAHGAPALRYSNVSRSGTYTMQSERHVSDAAIPAATGCFDAAASSRTLDPRPRAIAYSFKTHCPSMRPGTGFI